MFNISTKHSKQRWHQEVFVKRKEKQKLHLYHLKLPLELFFQFFAVLLHLKLHFYFIFFLSFVSNFFSSYFYITSFLHFSITTCDRFCRKLFLESMVRRHETKIILLTFSLAVRRKKSRAMDICQIQNFLPLKALTSPKSKKRMFSPSATCTLLLFIPFFFSPSLSFSVPV